MMCETRASAVRPFCAYLGALALLAMLAGGSAKADGFYAGKTVKLGVSSNAGGGYDLYTRLLGRTIPKYLPGNPAIVVQNIPGGGGLKAAHDLYSSMVKDGTEFAEIHATTMLNAILGIAGKDIDPTRYVWVGSMASDDDVCSFWKTSGIRSFHDMLTKPSIIGGTGNGSQSFTFPHAINAVLGTKMKIVLGYKGTGDRLLALERGEITGSCGINASTMKSVAARQLGSGSLIPVVQSGLKPHPSFPDLPLTLSFAKTPEQHRILEAIFSQMQIARAYAAPPGIAPERARVLREAFMKSVRDPGLLAEAKKLKIDILPSTGEEVQDLIAGLAGLPDDLKAKVKAAVGG